MTIEKGESWGRPLQDDGGVVTARDDADVARLAHQARAGGDPLRVSVQAGDLLATLGLTETRSAAERYAYPMDLGLLRLSDVADPPAEPAPFVAHMTAEEKPSVAATIGRILGNGRPITAAVMNAAWLGELRLAPKAHPNDGLLDVIEGRVPFRERREANRRARSGSHLPHPSLKVVRVPTWTARFPRPQAIKLDGVLHGYASVVTVDVVPDAFTLVA